MKDDNLDKLKLARQYNLVTIATFCQPDQIQQMRAQLEQEGIWSLITKEQEMGVTAIFWGSWRGLRIQVKEQDTYKALRVLGIESKPSKIRKVRKAE